MFMTPSLLWPGHRLISTFLYSNIHTLIPFFLTSRRVFVRFLAEHKQGESVEDAVPSGHSPPSAPLSPAVQHCLDEVLHSVKGGHGAVLVMLLR